MSINRVSGPGSYNAICDVCGLKYKAYELKRRYDGAMVCKYDWEPRHDQEFVRAKRDNKVLPFIRPDSAGSEIGPTINCGALSFGYQTIASLNSELVNGNVTVYKLRIYGGGNLTVPSGKTLTVACTLEIE